MALGTINQKAGLVSTNWVLLSLMQLSSTTDSPHQEQHSTDPLLESETVCPSL